MKLLLDTHIFLWIAANTVPQSAAFYIHDKANTLLLSPVCLWEMVIKRGLSRSKFEIDPYVLYNGLIENGYEQLHVTAQHALTVGALPMLHKDPFDRLLLAQSISEGIPLLTFDKKIAEYTAPVILLHK
jgi:PIN domain nuclease of toxin-antitoxin system